jgi:DNA-binding response OmpR family regulator
MKILIADASFETIENITLAIEIYLPDWELMTTDNGKQCLDIIKNGTCPDVMVLGMKLADMSGFELTNQIRDDSDIPIIVLSNDKDITTLVKAFNIGANDYMVQPLNKAIFNARLKAFISRREWDIQAKEINFKKAFNQI